MKMKKVLAFLLVLVMVVGMLPAMAITAAADWDTTGYKTHDISTASLTITGNDNYVITGTSEATIDDEYNLLNEDHYIRIDGGTHTLVLDNVRVELAGFDPTTWDPGNWFPLELKNNAKVTLRLIGENTLSWSYLGFYYSRSAISVPAGCSLTIESASEDGELNCFGGCPTAERTGFSVIGSDSNQDSGKIVIKSGIVNVKRILEEDMTKSDTGAAIGGGTGRKGEVEICGGVLNIIGDSKGAAIGGGNNSSGSSVRITGGTININKGTMNGATSGIGGPTASSTDEVIIMGGTINAPYVSGATNGSAALYLTTITVPGQNSLPVTGIKNGEADYGSTGVSTDAAGKLYLWLPAAEETTVTFTIGETNYTASGAVTAENGGAFSAIESAGEDPAAVAKAEKKAAVLEAFGALPLEKENDKYSITGTVSAFFTATGAAETAVAEATATEIGWTANDVEGWTGYETYAAALTLKTQAETLKTEAISAFTAIDGTTYEAVKDALEAAEAKVTAATAFGWDEETEIAGQWTNYSKLTDARALKQSADKAAAQAAAEAAFGAIPAYDGTNHAAMSQAVGEAAEAITAALAAGCTQAEIESWTGYSRYASAKEISEHLPTYPTVTLTVLGLPEDEEETGHYFIEPTNFTVMNSSNVAEVVTQALALADIDCDYTGQTAAGGDFFIQGIGGQYNSGSLGWMYMVNSNAYIPYGMNNYPIQGGENILVYYSTKGYNGGKGDSNVANPVATPYGRYGSFQEISNVAGQKNTVDLRSGSADAVLA